MTDSVDFANLFEDVLARAKVLEGHRKACVAVPCGDCLRFACLRCGKAAPAEDEPCPRCRVDAALVVARESIPRRFRWSLGASVELLAERVRLPAGVRGVEAALAWSREPMTRGLVLRGGSGAGKTSLAAAMFGAWLSAHRQPSARFVEAISLSLARSHHPLGSGEAPAIVEAMSAPLVVLDDLGQEQPNRAEIVIGVVMARHNAGLPTWTTTWLEDAAIESRYGGGVLRRLTEDAKVVELAAAVSS